MTVFLRSGVWVESGRIIRAVQAQRGQRWFSIVRPGRANSAKRWRGQRMGFSRNISGGRLGTPGSASPNAMIEESLLRDLKIVGHREYARDAIGANTCEILVTLAVDHSFERDVTVLDDDANWFLNPECISLERGIPVNSAIQLQPLAIVDG